MKKIFAILAVVLVITGCLSSQTLPNGKPVPRNKQLITYTFCPSKYADSMDRMYFTKSVEYEFDIDFQVDFSNYKDMDYLNKVVHEMKAMVLKDIDYDFLRDRSATIHEKTNYLVEKGYYAPTISEDDKKKLRGSQKWEYLDMMCAYYRPYILFKVNGVMRKIHMSADETQEGISLTDLVCNMNLSWKYVEIEDPKRLDRQVYSQQEVWDYEKEQDIYFRNRFLDRIMLPEYLVMPSQALKNNIMNYSNESTRSLESAQYEGTSDMLVHSLRNTYLSFAKNYSKSYLERITYKTGMISKDLR